VVILLPAAAFIPTAVMLLGGAGRGTREGMAEELSHSWIHLLPGTPGQRVLALAAVPTLQFALALAITWLPALIWAPYPLWVRLGTAAVISVAALAVTLWNTWIAQTTHNLGIVSVPVCCRLRSPPPP